MYSLSWRSFSIVATSSWTWSINIYRVIFNPVSSRSTRSRNIINGYILVRRSSNIIYSRTSVISSTVTNVSVVNDNRILDIYSVSATVITWVTVIVNMSNRNEVPTKIWRYITAANVNVDINAWSHWRPAILAATTSPIYPSWSPSGIWQPNPVIVSVVHPTPVVEWSPAPIVVRYPSVAILCHSPTAISVIRPKICLVYIWSPNVPIFRVVDPSSVRRKLIVECLQRNIIILCFCNLCGSGEEQQKPQHHSRKFD
ncbi:hypothetical protein D3C85_1095600 [compost metagenome]